MQWSDQVTQKGQTRLITKASRDQFHSIFSSCGGDIWRASATFAQQVQVSPKAVSSHLNNWALKLKFWNHVKSCSSTISILIIYYHIYIFIFFLKKACLKPKGPNHSDFNTSLPVLCSNAQSQHPKPHRLLQHWVWQEALTKTSKIFQADKFIPCSIPQLLTFSELIQQTRYTHSREKSCQHSQICKSKFCANIHFWQGPKDFVDMGRKDRGFNFLVIQKDHWPNIFSLTHL